MLNSIFTPLQLSKPGPLFVRLHDSLPPRAFSASDPDSQRVGENIASKFPYFIAKILGYPEEEAVSYTGHCWRRTAATIAAGNGATTSEIQLLGGWDSQRVVDTYIAASDHRRAATAALVSVREPPAVQPQVVERNENLPPNVYNISIQLPGPGSVAGVRNASIPAVAPIGAGEVLIDPTVLEALLSMSP